MTTILDGLLFGLAALLAMVCLIALVVVRTIIRAQFEPCESCGGSGHTGTRVQRETVKT